MAESRIKIKTTANKINEIFKKSPSPYYYIKYFNGEKYYKGKDNVPIVFEALIRHNEIGNRSIERSTPYTIDTLEKTLEKKVKEYEQEQKRITVISAICIGGYNDTLMYEVTIDINGTNEIFILEKHTHCIEEPNSTWEISSKNIFSEDEKKQIIDIISKNPPSIFSDAPPQIYDSIDEIEI